LLRHPLARRAAVAGAGLLLCVSACSGSSATPTPSPTPDPQAVLAQSLSNFEQARSFHLSGTIAGSIDMGSVSRLSGSSIGLSGKLDLKGGTIVGDVDITRSAARVTVTFPSLFGLTVDVIEVDGYSYSKINLTSEKYTKSKLDPSALASAVPGAAPDVSDLEALLRDLLASPAATVTPAGSAIVDGRQAHRFDVAIAPALVNEEFRTLVPSLPQDVTVDSASGTYLVYADTLQPASFEIAGSSASLGNLDVSLTLTAYGLPVTIEAPPASELQE
jgi:hypothetical protein